MWQLCASISADSCRQRMDATWEPVLLHKHSCCNHDTRVRIVVSMFFSVIPEVSQDFQG